MKADAACSTPRSEPDLADERRLVERLRAGDRAALETMIADHQQRVQRLVRRLTGWTGDSDDLVQEVFLNALTGVRSFKGQSRLSTWLTRIAINACRSHQRTRLLRATFWKKIIQNTREEDVEQADASIPQEQKDRQRLVTDAVRRLKGKYREVIVLHYLEEMPAEDIQQVLGISRNTVEVRLHRARKMLEETLKPLIQE